MSESKVKELAEKLHGTTIATTERILRAELKMTMSNEQALSVEGEFNPKVAMEWLAEVRRLTRVLHEIQDNSAAIGHRDIFKMASAALASSNAAHAATDKPKADGAREPRCPKCGGTSLRLSVLESYDHSLEATVECRNKKCKGRFYPSVYELADFAQFFPLPDQPGKAPEKALSTESVIHILNTHFPTKWSNENLRERVIEFGLDVAKQAAPDLPSVEEMADVIRTELAKHWMHAHTSRRVASAVLDFLRSRAR